PLAELDLARALRLDPDGLRLPRLRHRRHRAERRRVALQRPQLVEQLVDLLRAEARADVPGVDELIAAVIAEDERPEARCTPARSLREAADHELLLAVRLDLQPVARPLPGQVPGLEPLRHDPFELLLL